MTVTKAFNDAVNSGNVLRVRIMMKDSFLVDPSFTEFKEMETVAARMKGLYECYDGIAFEENKDKWDESYMDKQMVKLISNFSHERISHVKNVVRYLRPIKVTAPQRTERRTSSTNSMPMSYEEQKSQDKINGNYLGSKEVTYTAIGTVAGAVVGGVVASAASVTIVGGTLVGAAIGGITAFIIVNEEVL